MLRIRENFVSDKHQLHSIKDYETKWRMHLMNCVQNKDVFNLKCKKIDKDLNCIEVKKNGEHLQVSTSYLIGLDYLEHNVPFMVEPKFEDENKDFSIDFYDILFKSLPFVKSDEDISDLYFVDFSKAPIEINQQDDFLTPILIIQFVTYLEKICHTGLQKGYYLIEENLDNKIKGKILIKDTIKKNHFKSKYTKTFCKYQEFGFNTAENQFLRYTFQFCLNYLNQFKKLELINNLDSKLGFVRSSIENIALLANIRKEITVKKNPLFPMYENALKLANLILRRSSFNITNTTKSTVSTFPYWINMSKLFEIHVLRLIRTAYKEGVYYQKKYAERIPDIVINRNDLKLLVDVKYKPYAGKTIEIEDIRQIAVYARMKSIFKDLGLQSHDILDSLIIYPKVDSKNQCIDDTVLSKKTELQNYFNIYKLEVVIPTINKN